MGFIAPALLVTLLAAPGGSLAGSAPGATPAALVARPWKAVAASGQVDASGPVADAASWRRVVRGDELAPRTTVRTGRKGRATLVRGESVLLVDHESRLDLPGTATAERPSAVIQGVGRVVYEIDKKDSRHFEVVTPFLVAGVKGTVFMVAVSERGASVVVREGTVEVTSSLTGERMDVHSGESVMLDAAQAPRMELVSGGSTGAAGERARSESEKMSRLAAAQDAASVRDAADERRSEKEAQADAGPASDSGAGVAGLDAVEADLTGGKLEDLWIDLCKDAAEVDQSVGVGIGLPISVRPQPLPEPIDPVTGVDPAGPILARPGPRRP